MPVPAFLQEGKIALREKEDPKPFVKWEAEYSSGKKDKAFLVGYMKKRAMLKMPSAELAEEVFSMLSEEDLNDKELISSIIFYDANVQYVPGGKIFNYVMKHYKQLDSVKLVKSPLAVMEVGTNNYFQKNIVAKQREAMLPVMTSAYRRVLLANKVPADEIVVAEKNLAVRYYAETGNEKKLNIAAKDFVQNGIMKLDFAARQLQDSVTFAKFMEPFNSGKKDSTVEESFRMKRIMQHSKMCNVSYKLRDAAEAVYNTSTNKAIIAKATDWARQANEWFPHFSNAAVYAGLLCKSGKAQQAAAVMRAASQDNFLSGKPDLEQLLQTNAEVISKGEIPKSLWKVK